MKILLDENTDAAIGQFFPGYEVHHVNSLDWKGLQNGKLLERAEREGFELLVTADKNLMHQQNLSKRSIAVIVLDIHPNNLLNEVACIPDIRPGQIKVVLGPHPKRQKPRPT